MSNSSFSATEPPSAEQLKRASNIAVFDEKSKQVSFGDLIKAGDGERVIAVFIRHFYCGFCQAYVTHINELLTPETAAKNNVRLFFVGCGDSSLIKGYSEVLNNKFPIYSQPNKDIYVALGMTLRTLDKAGDSFKKPSHAKKSTGSSVWSGVTKAFKMGNLLARFGDIKQQGGEFVFVSENGAPKAIYTHRMKHAQDHAEFSEVLAAAGVSSSGAGASNGPVETAKKPDLVKRETAAGAVSGAGVASGPLEASGVHGAGTNAVSPSNVPAAQPSATPAPAEAKESPEPTIAAGSVGSAAVSGGPLASSATHGGSEAPTKVSPPNNDSLPAAITSSSPFASPTGSPAKTAAAPQTSEPKPVASSTSTAPAPPQPAGA